MAEVPQRTGRGAVVRQLFRYAMIGLFTNLVGYLLYLLLTYLWDAPKLTMTALYCIGALTGFFANRRFTFRHHGRIDAAVLRYAVAHLSGYLLNLLLLVLFVDWWGFPHQIVQAVAIVVVAIVLFALSRYFVFASPAADKGVARS